MEWVPGMLSVLKPRTNMNIHFPSGKCLNHTNFTETCLDKRLLQRCQNHTCVTPCPSSIDPWLLLPSIYCHWPCHYLPQDGDKQHPRCLGNWGWQTHGNFPGWSELPSQGCAPSFKAGQCTADLVSHSRGGRDTWNLRLSSINPDSVQTTQVSASPLPTRTYSPCSPQDRILNLPLYTFPSQNSFLGAPPLRWGCQFLMRFPRCPAPGWAHLKVWAIRGTHRTIQLCSDIIKIALYAL